jgi:hypothetical protein
MISIVDPEELKNVLRPTVYAPAVGALQSRFSDGVAGSQQTGGWSDTSHRDEQRGTDGFAVESITSSQHSG